MVNQKGERFVDELMTRDEVSRAVFTQTKEGNEVFLDIRHLGDEFISKNLPQEKKTDTHTCTSRPKQRACACNSCCSL